MHGPFPKIGLNKESHNLSNSFFFCEQTTPIYIVERGDKGRLSGKEIGSSRSMKNARHWRLMSVVRVYFVHLIPILCKSYQCNMTWSDFKIFCFLEKRQTQNAFDIHIKQPD